MESVSPEREIPGREGEDAAARRRAAVATYARNEASLRRTARRFSLCEDDADDADDALQRGLEILLRRAPNGDARELIRWIQTVVRHEALAIRRDRERTLPPASGSGEDWVSLLPSGSDGPAERAERREAVARSREALQALKPQELRALTLLAEGYSYAEIGEITSWSQTKINRCLAEGRERFRALVSRSEDGRRCAEMQPLISAFCDGEADARKAAELREHLRACAHCRATVRTYRAAPAAVAALAPVLPLHRSLLERAHDALGDFAARLGGKAETVTQVASGGGASGAGAATLAKVAAVCLGTAGGAAACVAGGLVPPPLEVGDAHPQPPRLERRAQSPEPAPVQQVEYEPAPPAEPKPQPHPAPAPEPEPAPAETAPEASEPAAASGAVEYAPPPEPAPAPEPAAAGSGGGDPAGEFGP